MCENNVPLRNSLTLVSFLSRSFVYLFLAKRRGKLWQGNSTGEHQAAIERNHHGYREER